MDDTTAQNTKPTDQQQVQPFDQTQGKPVVQSPQPVSVGKEAQAVVIPKPEEQWVTETAPEAKIEQELKEVGVEATKGETLQLHPDVAKAGVSPTGTASPVPTEPTLKFPITEEKAKQSLIHKKIRNSITWLAALVLRQIKQIQFKQKEAK